MVLLPPPPQTADEQAAAAAAASASAAGAGSTAQAAPTDTTIPAIFYRPGDLRQQLQVPLGNTLAPKAPSTDAFSGREADTVATLTLSNSFNMTTQGSTILLDRP